MVEDRQQDTLKQLLLAAGTIDDGVISQLQPLHSDEEIEWLLRECVWHNSTAKLSPKLFAKVLSLGVPLDLDDLYLKLLQSQEASKALATTTSNIYVACMPKSGSSYLAHSLSTALDIPFQHLTTSHPNPSAVGMNGREQEIDELAIIKKTLRGTGFVAQHHTKSTPYLMRLFSSYNIGCIVIFRNIFDGMISLDAMLQKSTWSNPLAQGALKIPVNYSELSFDERMAGISNNYGTWCIDFYLSWKRVAQEGFNFLWVEYDKHLSRSSGDKNELCDLLIEYLKPSSVQEAKLYEVIVGETVSDARARFRSGESGEGVDKVPLDVQRHLINYAKKYNKELEASDMDILFGRH